MATNLYRSKNKTEVASVLSQISMRSVHRNVIFRGMGNCTPPIYVYIRKPCDSTTYVYPAMISISVDLPAPEGPMMAVSSPDWNSPLTRFRMHFDSEMYKYL
jgi:hypothetical protein